MLSQLLNKLLSTPSDLIKVLNATVATIRYADVESWDDWGIIVNGAYASGSNNTSYAKAAGGFAGNLEGTVLGEKGNEDAGISAQNIRSVIAGEYAGGCFGIADVAGVANISAGSDTSLLDKLLQLGRTDVLDAFRSYVYYGTVSGSKDAGLSVSANTAIKSGQNNQVTYSGTAGGFGGSLLNGSVKNSKVTELSNVRGLNSVGGFVGYSGKSGVVKADKIDVLGDNTGQLLGGALGVMDIFGSHIDDCAVTGTDEGYTVQSTNGDEQIAGGFIGYNAQLEYGNKPGETTKTTPSEAKTPTYPLDILKKDKKGDKKLAGAKFSLYRSSEDAKNGKNAIKVSGSNGNYVVDSTSTTTEFESVEEITRAGYNLHVNGLAEGTYYLVETQAPAGYNKLTAPIKIEITKSADTEVNNWTISKDGTVETDKIIDIENSTGSLLPSTGGMGTIIFAVIAAILVLGVAVSFIRDKRKNA